MSDGTPARTAPGPGTGGRPSPVTTLAAGSFQHALETGVNYPSLLPRRIRAPVLAGAVRRGASDCYPEISDFW